MWMGTNSVPTRTVKESPDMKMKDIGEFGFIRSIKDTCVFSHTRLVRGIGDDCAVIGPYDDRVFLISTDLFFEDVHFIRGKISPEALGRKALSVNLSDIAAMGGKPLHVWISLAVPGRTDVEYLQAVYTGVKNGCRRYGVNILGGDTSASTEKVVISMTVLGEAQENEVIYRNGASPGDRIYVTGTTGDAAGGLMLLQGCASAPDHVASRLINAHNHPVPFVETGRKIARSGLASAMIDLSDGLIADLGHICEASGVGACLVRNALPVSESLMSLAGINEFDPYKPALYGGEDYRLLMTVPEKNVRAFERMFEKDDPCQMFRIGEVTDDPGIIMLLLPDGTMVRVEMKGFDHFRPPAKTRNSR